LTYPILPSHLEVRNGFLRIPLVFLFGHVYSLRLHFLPYPHTSVNSLGACAVRFQLRPSSLPGRRRLDRRDAVLIPTPPPPSQSRRGTLSDDDLETCPRPPKLDPPLPILRFSRLSMSWTPFPVSSPLALWGPQHQHHPLFPSSPSIAFANPKKFSRGFAALLWSEGVDFLGDLTYMADRFRQHRLTSPE